jgi:hypothetical protein
VIFSALIGLFALDSITTYVGVGSGQLREINPIVNALIDAFGLGNAMVSIFVYKTFFLWITRFWQPREWVTLAWRGLFVVYAGILGIAWSCAWLI